MNVFFFFFLFFTLGKSADPSITASAIKDSNGNVVVVDGLVSDRIGYAVYQDQRTSNGWERIQINMENGGDDRVKMYAAGLLEGYLSFKSIDEIFSNYLTYWGWNNINEAPANVSSFMRSNMEWSIEQSFQGGAFWDQISLVFSQLDGMVDGYKKGCSSSSCVNNLGFYELFFLNSGGDLYGVLEKFLGSDNPTRFVDELGHSIMLPCSALVKMVEDEVYFGHITWRSYMILNKFYKIYNIPLEGVEANVISFSSSPGFLTSKEDFYLMGEGESALAVTETTNGVYNMSLYDAVHFDSLFYWPRITAANRLATTTSSWIDYMKKEASGTYTNQWIVYDFNKDARTDAEALMIYSEMPGIGEEKDVTSYLQKQGFWSSYNVPYFEDIYKISGYEMMYQKFGDAYSYSKCPRAQIFAQRAPQVQTQQEMMDIMLYNHYTTDPYQLNDPANGIAARYDLRATQPQAFGGIDGKITSTTLMKQKKWPQAYVHAGPTNKNNDTKPFEWSQFPSIKIRGQCEKYDFDWILIDQIE